MKVDIERLRALCNAATSGPWDVLNHQEHLGTDNDECAWWSVRAGEQELIDVQWSKRSNATFIAAARTALPEALDEIEALRHVQSQCNEYLAERGQLRARLAEVERERDDATARANLEAAHHAHLRKERDEARKQLADAQADATLALALDQEQIDELTATVQRESAWVNERDGIIAHLSGVLHEIARCTSIENARTFAKTARVNLAERHAGLWSPGPRDDAADWKPGHHREQSAAARIERETAERIAQWLERADPDFAAPHIMGAIARRIRSGTWRRDGEGER